MGCNIIYNNKVYSEAEFSDYILTHPEEFTNNEYLSARDVKEQKVSPKVLKAVDAFIKRIGVTLKDVTINGNKINHDGVARIMENLIEIVNDKGGVVRTEEAMHFAVEITEQTNPELFKQMMAKIGDYSIYDDTLATYRNIYKTKEGKPDIRKIKKEAVARLLTQYVVKGEDLIEEPKETTIEQSKVVQWWEKVKNWLKQLFAKAEFDPFETVAKNVLNDRFEGTAADINTKEGTFYHSTLEEHQKNNPKQTELYNKLAEEAQNTIKVYVNEDGKETNYYQRDGNRVKNRVTDIAKRNYRNKFGEEPASEFDKALAQGGTNIHDDIEDIIRRALDDNGFINKAEDGSIVYRDSQLVVPHTGDKVFYQALQDMITERLAKYPEGTRIMPEAVIYDPKIDEAGTIDFLAILPDEEGKVDILDWKSISLDTNKYKDIPWFKVEPYNLQISEYKRILKDVYGYKGFRLQRAIPIIAKYRVDSGESELLSLTIGNSDVNLEQYDYLLPVPTRDESTGDKKLDEFIGKLYALYDSFKKASVEDKRKDLKVKQLNALYSAIRHLQVKQNFDKLFEQVEILITNTDNTLKKIAKYIKETNPEDLSKDELVQQSSEYATKLLETKDILTIYAEMHTMLKDVFGNDTTEEEDKTLNNIKELSLKSIYALDEIKSLSNKLGEKFIASSRGIKGLLNPEPAIRQLRRVFNTASDIPNTAFRSFWRLTEEINNRTEHELADEMVVLEDFAKRLKPKSKETIDLLKKKDKEGRKTNFLIDQYSKEFYDTLKKKSFEKTQESLEWIKENIDKEAFEKWAKEYREEQIALINETVYVGDEEEQRLKKEEDIQDVIDATDLSKDYAWFQYKNTKQFPIQEWYSKEYKEILKDKDILDFYNYTRKWNKEASDTGYIHKGLERNFLPFVQTGLTDKIAFGNSWNFINNIVASLTLQDNVGYGKYNELTGELEDVLPKYFTNDISLEKKDQKGNTYRDYNNISDDLVKNMVLLVGQVINYKNKSDFEGQVKLLQFIEENKRHLPTNKVGKIIGTALPGNDKNASLLESEIKDIFYGQQFTGELSDYELNNPSKLWNKLADKASKIGVSIPKVNEEVADKKISLSRTINGASRLYSLKVLAGNLSTSIVQFLSGNAQALINSGKYYTTKEHFISEMKHITNKIIRNNDKLHIALMKRFLPVEDQLRKEMDKLSFSDIKRNSLSDTLLIMMRTADHIIQYSNFLSFLDNAIVIDGKMYNAREYYRDSPEYSKRLYLPQQQRRELEKEFENNVKELKEKYSFLKSLSVDESGNIISPLIDIKDESVDEYRNIIKQVGKRLAGNITKDDSNNIRRSVLGRAMMVFKNWIPGGVQQRFGSLRYTEGVRDWEWGRVRTFTAIMGEGALTGLKGAYNILTNSDEGVKFILDLYEKQKQEHIERYGSDTDFLSKEEFFDLVRKNMLSNIKEAISWISLIGIFIAAKTVTPPDKDDKGARAFFNYQLRFLDKLQDELTFYYSPNSIDKLLNGGIFPALGVLTDGIKFITQLLEEGFGIVLDKDEWKDSAHPTKYLFRALPVTKELLNYIAFFAPELAKQMGIKITPVPLIK